MEWKKIATISVTILIALLGYIFAYLNNLRLAQRKGRLERVDRQLKELYGPLFALGAAGRMAWTAFRDRYRLKGDFWDTGDPPTQEKAAAWRLWMTEVFMPLNLKMVRLITEHSDLLEESGMPEALLDLCAHIYAYKPVIKAWESKDYSEHVSVVKFPAKQFHDYTTKSYLKLKKKQAKLLGKKN